MSAFQIKQSIVDSIASAFEANLETVIRQLADQHNFDANNAISQFCNNSSIFESSCNNLTPIDCHVASKVATPVASKVATPVASEVATPVVSQVATPVASEVATPVVSQVASKVATPVASEATSQVSSKSNKKLPTPAFALPWTNNPIPHCCDALRSYYGVFSQCTNLKFGDSNFCKTCSKKGDQQPCGTIYDRAKDGFIAPNGKKPAHYTVFMKKMNKTELDVRNELAKFDLSVDNDIFVAPKVGRGRPKKAVSVVDDSDDSSLSIKKAGRPKKVSLDEPSVDDLIHNLNSPHSPPPSLSNSLNIILPNDNLVVAKQFIPVSPNDSD